jgi:hypothetical protein
VKSPYEILQVPPDASQDEISAAYRRLAQQYHPDKVSHLAPDLRELADRHMKEINAAYETLRQQAGAPDPGLTPSTTVAVAHPISREIRPPGETFKAGDRAPTLRPLGVGDVLDELFAVYRRGFKTFLGITALVQVPLAILSLPLYAASSRFGQRIVVTEDFMAAAEAFGGTIAAIGAVLAIFTIVGNILMTAATSYATSAIYLGQVPTMADAYRFARGRFWALFRLGILLGAAFLGLFLLFLLPAFAPMLLPLMCITFPVAAIIGIYLAVNWSLSTPALVLEEPASAIRALRRSVALIRGAWWRTLLTLFLLSILVGVIQFLASGLLEAVVAGAQLVVAPGADFRPEWLTVLGGLFQSLAGVLYGPLMYIGLTIMYYDRRVRAEAFDLTVLARQLAQEPPDAPSP